MGSLRGLSQKLITETAEAVDIAVHTEQIQQFWEAVRTSIYSLIWGDVTVRIYQDGLPLCNQESLIVKELAEKGSINHQLIMYLQHKGAILMGTESPALLLQEYQLIKDFLVECTDVHSPPDIVQFKRRGEDILQERDQFIANRINTTLQPGEEGVLFLGQLHDITPYLAEDIRVKKPAIQGPVMTRGE